MRESYNGCFMSVVFVSISSVNVDFVTVHKVVEIADEKVHYSTA